jgi:drug/metabolite transporter (DMT)-like permease
MKTVMDIKYALRGIPISIAAHTSFGLYVVLAKDLFQQFPPFGLLACAFGFSIILAFLLLRKEVKWVEFTHIGIWILAAIAVARSITKMLAVQFTLATYVQLLDLTAPFASALLARAFIKERLPFGTIPALIATTFGAYLVIAIHPAHIHLPNGYKDLLGIGLALISSIFMAVLMVLTGFLAQDRSNPSNIYLQQALALLLTYACLSFLYGESWEPLLSPTIPDVGYLLIFFIIVTFGGGLSVFALARVKTTLFSTLLSLRLVVAVIAGWIILSERLTTPYQIFGVGLVVVAITWYLSQQRTP